MHRLLPKSEQPKPLIGESAARKAAFGLPLTQPLPAAHLNRRHALSPIDTLIGIKVGCGLCRSIPVVCPIRLDFNPLVHLRVRPIP